MNRLREIRSIVVVYGIISIILGIVLVVIPGQTQLLINTIVGVALIVVGIAGAVRVLSMKNNGNTHIAIIVLPIITGILGLFVLLNPDVTIFTVGILMSIFALAMAIDSLMVAINAGKNAPNKGALLIFGIIHLIFAVFMAWNVFATMTAIVMLAGIYLIVNGIIVLATSHVLKNIKSITLTIEDGENSSDMK